MREKGTQAHSHSLRSKAGGLGERKGRNSGQEAGKVLQMQSAQSCNRVMMLFFPERKKKQVNSKRAKLLLLSVRVSVRTCVWWTE